MVYNGHYIYLYIIIVIWLVVLTALKNVKVNGKDDIPYIMGNKKMFQTTNQSFILLQLLFWLRLSHLIDIFMIIHDELTILSMFSLTHMACVYIYICILTPHPEPTFFLLFHWMFHCNVHHLKLCSGGWGDHIWASHDNSLTWNKAHIGMIHLTVLTMISRLRENSEVVIIWPKHTQIYIYIYMYIYIYNIWAKHGKTISRLPSPSHHL